MPEAQTVGAETAALVEAIKALPVRPLGAGEIRRSLPEIGRFTLLRWVRDLQRSLDRIGAAVPLAEEQAFSEAATAAIEEALWRLSAGRKDLLALAFLILGVPTEHPVKLSKTDSVPKGIDWKPDWKDLESRLNELAATNKYAADFKTALDELHDLPAIQLRNEISHSLASINELVELCWVEVVHLEGINVVRQEPLFVVTEGMMSRNDFRPETLWRYVLEAITASVQSLVEAIEELTALVSSGAVYLERPQLVYRNVNTGGITITDPRPAKATST